MVNKSDGSSKLENTCRTKIETDKLEKCSTTMMMTFTKDRYNNPIYLRTRNPGYTLTMMIRSDHRWNAGIKGLALK